MSPHAVPPAAIDLVFELDGESLPPDYEQPLWRALVAQQPLLERLDATGVHRVRAAHTERGMLLSRRARLALRVPGSAADAVEALAGRALDVDGAPLRLGRVHRRAIVPTATLKSAFVVSGIDDELAHHERVGAMLREAIGPSVRAIFGRMSRVAADGAWHAGSSVVVHDLGAEPSLHLQVAGLGPYRRFGCGLFVPYKEIVGLG